MFECGWGSSVLFVVRACDDRPCRRFAKSCNPRRGATSPATSVAGSIACKRAHATPERVADRISCVFSCVLRVIAAMIAHANTTQPPSQNHAAHAGNTAARLTVTAVRGEGYVCSWDVICANTPAFSSWYNCCDSYPQFTVNGEPQVGNDSNHIDDNDNPTWNLTVSH